MSLHKKRNTMHYVSTTQLYYCIQMLMKCMKKRLCFKKRHQKRKFLKNFGEVITEKRCLYDLNLGVIFFEILHKKQLIFFERNI